MIGFNGGLIGAARETSASQSVPGVWTAQEQYLARLGSKWTISVLTNYFEFKVWGAGGGGGNGYSGGGGAFVTGKYRLGVASTLTFVVGSAGKYNPSLNVATYGAGGAKGTTYNYPVGSGGGLSGIFVTNSQVYQAGDTNGNIASTGNSGVLLKSGQTIENTLLIAAGGGGASYAGNAGAGGITAGEDGQVVSGATRGTGATWTGPGFDTGSGGASGDGTSGGRGFGGTSTGGGGGGSGFYGGGAGANASSVAPGAGGSSYYWTTQSKPSAFLEYADSSASGIAGLGINAGNANDSLNATTYGRGGASGAHGQNGLIAYRVSDSFEGLTGASWQLITHTGSDQTLVVL